MKENNSKNYLNAVRNGLPLTIKEQFILIMRLSFPAILAQISSVIMGYIDASMVGMLGYKQAASIGLVSSTTWLLGGIAYSSVTGFTVQVAQAIGGKKEEEAKDILCQSLVFVFFISLVFLGIGVSISPHLPGWLGGSKGVSSDASTYFLINSLGIPAAAMNVLAGRMLQSCGNMKVPGILNSLMCLLDIIFNFVLVFPTSEYTVAGITLTIKGFNMGVAGAALGTALAELVTALIMMGFLLFHSPLQIKKREHKRITGHHKKYVKKALIIALPVAFEHFVVCLAMVVTTRIIAPLGAVAIAANSFAITAESLCYMPGYGISEAATTLVGQSFGAGRSEMARQFARRTTYVGTWIMIFGSIIMYILAPYMIGLLTKEPEVLELGTRILRIEAFAESFYVASIIISGALRGAGDTFVPSIMNFISLWLVRIPLSYLLAQKYGLTGAWIAMCIELIFRGSIFYVRLLKEKWIKQKFKSVANEIL